MSDWRSLGTLSVGEEWDIFPEISFGASMFRLTQTFNAQWRPWSAKLLISASVELSSFKYRYGTRRYYPSLEPRVIVWSIPTELEERGLIARDFWVKRNFYGRVAPQTNWQVTLEEYLR